MERLKRFSVQFSVPSLRSIRAIVGMGMLAGLGMAPAIAQSNFGNLTLNPGTLSGTLTGTTGGTTSLPAIVSNRDQQGRNCLGFGDPNPDHVLVLKQPVSKLKLSVASGGSDTTLVVSGPNGILHCADAGFNKDATLEDTNWQPGTYQVWIGTAEPNVRRSYRLMVQGN